MATLTPETALLLIPLVPLAGFVINGVWGRKLSPTMSGVIASAALLVSFLLTNLCMRGIVKSGDDAAAASSAVISHGYDWINTGWINLSFRMHMDQLGMVMALIITGVGFLIHVYSIGYMAHDKGYWRYFAYLNLFCFSMLCLVLGDNLVLLFLGWEGVGLCSYLLIGFWFDDIEKSKAGKKAFVANRVGDLFFLLGMFLIAWHFRTLTITGPLGLEAQAALEQAQGLTSSWPLSLACLFLFIGACGKSAQIPLYVWLPDAMAGPTPVSALIHAATMVTAGVYMCCRLNFLYMSSEWVMPVITMVGALTALFAASIGLVQRDIKKVLAYSTVSQLGFMFMAVGTGAYAVAVFHLMTHAFFKALLFLGSGSVIHALEAGYGHGNPDSQDLRLMGGLRHKMPWTCWTMFIGGLALAGIPGLSGFFSKDEILFNVMGRHGVAYQIAYGMGLCAAALTAFYTARLLALAFFGKFRGDAKVWNAAHESPNSMTGPLCVLAILSVIGGYISLPHLFGHGHDHFTAMLTGGVFNAAAGHGEHSATTEAINMAVSSLIAIAMFFVAFNFYRRDGALGRAEARASGGLKAVFTMLLNKYYVDECYERFIIRPIRFISQLLLVFFDMLLIDTVFVNGGAFAVGALGHLMRRVQTGVVTHYLYLFAGGVIAILCYMLLS